MVGQCLNDVSLINFRLEDITSDENKLQQNSAVLCIVSYLMIAFIPVPALGILGCAVCGLSVGIMWPGTFSMAAASVKRAEQPCLPSLPLLEMWDVHPDQPMWG